MLNQDETLESLLIKDYKIIQNKNLYRFTSDSVILSKFADCKKGECVADVCSGSGIVGLHYYALDEERVKSVTLFELQQELAEMSQKSIDLNNLTDKFSVVRGKLQETSQDYKESFSLVLCNPPYKKKGSGEQNLTQSLAVARHEVEITQEEIIEKSAYMLVRGGRLCICQRVERFVELVLDLQKHLNISKIQFVTAKENSKPYLVLIEAYKGVTRPLAVLENYINK
jgi:tRNA1(Val) A37 N6-methylase TrmN6